MAKLVYGLNMSLDGYVNHEAFAPPGPALFRYFIHQTAGLAGSVYGRRMYEAMRYWDGDDPAWSADLREYAEAWRRQPKWVASRTLESVGPNATLLEGDIATAVRTLKAEVDGEIAIAGTEIAHHLVDLIDEYHIYLRPFVLGQGKPFFAGPRPALRLVAHERLADDTLKLTYVPG